MKKLFFVGMMIAGAALQPNEASAQSKMAYVSIDEVVQLMPEYKKAMGELAQFDSALQINYAETVQELNSQDSMYKG